MTTYRRYTEDEIAAIWNNAYWDAIGCGESEAAATAYANRKVSSLHHK
jgi:hypothetical protein